MTISEWLRQKILRFLKIETEAENPNSPRLTFISNDDEIQRNKVRECKVWYIGNSNEILNYYTGRETFGQAKNPIYNRNERNYFWGLSSTECNIKRIHTGIPNAIVTTLTNAIGCPEISVGNDSAISTDAIEKAKELNDKLQSILDKNDFKNKYNQQQLPLTMVEGDGAWKIIMDKDFCDYPLIQFYDSENVDYIEKYGKIIGVVFKDYYKNDKGKDYIKFETRRVSSEGDSIIEHDLFRLGKNNELISADLSEIPELADLQTITIPKLNRILAVPCRFFYDPINPKRGRSIFEGKIDLFDMADEIYSQLSQTNRVSTPVEYYNTDILAHTANGMPVLPNRYDRQFVAKQGIPNGDGLTNSKDIETTQPQLNFEQYINAFKAVCGAIFTGLLSPSTMGYDIAKKDNADAQREKEKVTIMTRNNIMDRETVICKDLVTLLLMIQEYMDTGEITITDYDISVKFDEFANPSFEQEIGILGSARAAGNISTERFVEMLWGDKLSKEDKQKEIDYIDQHNQQDVFSLGGEMSNEPTTDDSEDIQSAESIE